MHMSMHRWSIRVITFDKSQATVVVEIVHNNIKYVGPSLDSYLPLVLAFDYNTQFWYI